MKEILSKDEKEAFEQYANYIEKSIYILRRKILNSLNYKIQ